MLYGWLDWFDEGSQVGVVRRVSGRANDEGDEPVLARPCVADGARDGDAAQLGLHLFLVAPCWLAVDSGECRRSDGVVRRRLKVVERRHVLGFCCYPSREAASRLDSDQSLQDIDKEVNIAVLKLTLV